MEKITMIFIIVEFSYLFTLQTNHTISILMHDKGYYHWIQKHE